MPATIRVIGETRLDTFQIKELRKILRVSWSLKKTNEWVLRTAKNRDQLWSPTLDNRVWVTFTFLLLSTDHATLVVPCWFPSQHSSTLMAGVSVCLELTTLDLGPDFQKFLRRS